MKAKPPSPSPGADTETVVLSLPGMTLNGTIMPDFGYEHLSVDFCQFVPKGSVSLEVFVRRLETALDDEPLWNGRERRVIVGHSFGGMLALHWLLQPPPVTVSGLVLVAASAGPLFDAVRLRVPGPGDREFRVSIKPWMRFWNLPIVTRAAKAVLSPSRALEGLVDFRALHNRSDIAVDRAGWRNTDWRSMRAFRMALDGFDCRDELAGVTAPTIVLHGDRDLLFPISVAEALASGLPNAELRIVSGAGHALPLTHGGHVVRAVHDLLDG